MLDKSKCMSLIKGLKFNEVYDLILLEYDKMFNNLLIMKEVEEDLQDCTMAEKCQLMIEEFPEIKYLLINISYSFLNEEAKLDSKILNLMDNYKIFEDYYLKVLK